MIKINRLTLKNFKSFKKAEVPFAEGFTAIAGANASGKCVTGDTRVLLETGCFERIDVLVEKALLSAERKKFLEDGVIGFEPKKKVKIYSLNPDTLKVEPVLVNAFVKRTAPLKLLSIKTKSGREITATDYHPLFGIKDGFLKPVKAGELSRGMLIAASREIKPVKKTKLFEELFSLIEEKDNLFAPFNKKYLELVKTFAKEKNISIKEASKEFGVKKIVLDGLREQQSINIANLVKILKTIGYGYESIADMIPKIKGKTTQLAIKAPWRNSKEFARLLGYFFAEGSCAGGNIRFVNQNREIIEDIKNICMKVFGISVFTKKYKPNAFDIIVFSKPVGTIFSKFCLKENQSAKKKKLENIFFRHSEEEIPEFLNGYFSGDGHVSENSVSATTASRELALNVFDMLLMQNIQPRLKRTSKGIKKTGFKGNYFIVSVYGQENLKKLVQKISFVHKEKSEKLNDLASKTKRHHSNVDLIPNINNLIKSACIEHKIHYARKKDKNIKLKSYTDNSCFPSRKGLQEIIQKEFSLIKNPSKNLVALQKLALSEIFWDEITEIKEKTRKDRFVYDLSVNYNHNFIANNIIVHNSNILDSLLFVFGITSLKMLRASRLSELINHDSKEGYAKVEIDLKDADKEFNISRMIDSKGQSLLRLNGKKKTLSEITSLLLELGIKPTGHNIVVQGDVTRVIQMNARQRREILDDVAGLSEFEEKKEESIRKLEQVEQRIKDATLVLNERVNYLNELEKEKAAAQEFNSLSLELRRSRATIVFSEIKRNKDEVREVNQKISVLEDEIKKFESQKQELLAQEGPLEEKIQSLTQKMIENSENTYSTIVREIEEKKAQNQMIKEKLEENRLRLNSAKEKIVFLKEEKISLQKEISQKTGQVQTISRKISEKEAESKKLKKLIEEKTQSIKSKNLEELEAKIRQVRIETEKMQKELFEKTLLKEKILKEKELNEKLLSFLLSEQKNLEEVLSEKNEIESKLKEIHLLEPADSIEEKEKEIDDILSGIHSIKSKTEHLNDAIAKLKGVDSSCPVCDQKIDPATIRRLFEQREANIRELNIEIEKKHAQKQKALQEKQSLIHKLHELHDLKAQLNGYFETEGKLREIRVKINDAKQILKSMPVQSIIENEKKLSLSLEARNKEKNFLQEKIDAVKKSASSIELNQLLEKFDAVQAGKSADENQLAVLKTQLNESLKNRGDTVEKEKNSLTEQLLSLEKAIKEGEQKLVVAAKELEQREAKLQKATHASKLLEEEKNRLTTKLKNIEQKKEAAEQGISKKEKLVNELKISKSKNDIRLTDLEEEFKEFGETSILKEASAVELRKKLPEIEAKIKKLGAINMKALERFEELKKEVDFVKEKSEKLDSERKAVLELIDKIELKKINVFMDCFNHVSKKFSDIYYHFFEGEGRLGLSDPQNPTEGGLLIEAKYKEDRLKSIDAMSGGEKSLTALAFIFAIQSFDPAPFYIFDEADAALDKENSLKLGKMIRGISRQSQFISITHNDSIVKEADQIIGVALNAQKSSVIGLRLKGKISS